MMRTVATPTELSAPTELPVVELVHPMMGFPDDRLFSIAQLDDSGLLYRLQSTEHPGVRFLVVPPAPFFPAYAPEIGDDVVADLGIERIEDVFVLLVVDAHRDLTVTTANLRAPVVVNTASRRAAQVVLDDAGQPLAAPLLA